MKISHYVVDHPVPVTIVCLLIVAFGVMALGSMSQALFPDFTSPTVYVTLGYPGASPEEVESQVTSVLEDELSRIPGVQKLSSRSLQSFSAVSMEFDWSVDVDEKLAEIRERLNSTQARLPDGVSGSPSILKMNPSEMPVLTIGVERGGNLVDIARYVDDTVLPTLSSISGVSSIDVVGAPERELKVNLDLERLASLGLGPADVAHIVSISSAEIPSGTTTLGADIANMTTTSELSNPREVADLVILTKGRSTVRVADVAEVSVAEKAPERYALVNGERAILIDLSAQRGVDTIQVIDSAKAALARLERDSDNEVSFRYYRDQSKSISASIESVRNTAILGGILAILLLFLFLKDIRATVIIAISIPFSTLITFVGLYLGNHSLNLMTLGGITVSIGMIVDASIVMLENIWRHADAGAGPAEAAKLGASEMGSAVVASALTSIVVFIPLSFVQGITGIILRDVALTIIYALVGSVIAAVVIVPLASSAMLRFRKGGSSKNRTSSPIQARGMARIESGYSRLLDKVINQSGFVIALGFGLLLFSLATIGLLGFEFIPDSDSRELVIELDIPDGRSLERTREIAQEADRIIADRVPEAERRVFYVGQSGASSATATVATHAYGFIDLSEAGRSSFDLIPIIDSALSSAIPDIKVSVRNGGTSEKSAMAYGGAGFRVSVSALDIEDALAGAKVVEEALRRDGRVKRVDLSVTTGISYITNRIDLERAGILGVSATDAAQAVRIVLTGVQTGEMDFDGKRIPVVVMADTEGKSVDSLLDSTMIRSRSGQPLPVSSFSSTGVSRGMSEIPKQQKTPIVQIVAQTTGSDTRGIQKSMESEIDAIGLPPGVTWKMEGSAAETASSLFDLGISLLIGIVLVYSVMAIQFERYRQPFIILMAIPFVLIGSALALILFGSHLSIIAMLGIISLAGIAVNNAIIMVDYTNQLRTRDKLPLREALIKGASSRIRPILMTTITTLLGVVPLAFASGEARIIAVLGQVILGGLTISTLIAFFIIPSLYWLTERHAEANRLEKARVEPTTASPSEEV